MASAKFLCLGVDLGGRVFNNVSTALQLHKRWSVNLTVFLDQLEPVLTRHLQGKAITPSWNRNRNTLATKSMVCEVTWARKHDLRIDSPNWWPWNEFGGRVKVIFDWAQSRSVCTCRIFQTSDCNSVYSYGQVGVFYDIFFHTGDKPCCFCG